MECLRNFFAITFHGFLSTDIPQKGSEKTMVFSIVMIVGALGVAAWDGLRSDYSFWQFFIRFILVFTIYKLFDMICLDYFLLMKFHFFQFYYPEIESVSQGRKYGFNIKSQLFKLLILFPAISALAAWICTLFQ